MQPGCFVIGSAIDAPEDRLLNVRSFFVLGAGKAEMIQRVATGRDSFEDIPVKAIAPTNGLLTWYLDMASAGGVG